RKEVNASFGVITAKNIHMFMCTAQRAFGLSCLEEGENLNSTTRTDHWISASVARDLRDRRRLLMSSKKTVRWTKLLPRDMRQSVLDRLRPGQRCELRPLSEFAPLFPPVTAGEEAEAKAVELQAAIFCAAWENHVNLLKKYLKGFNYVTTWVMWI